MYNLPYTGQEAVLLLKNRTTPAAKSVAKPVTSMENSELVRLAQAGNDTAFAELADRCRKLIYWHMNRLGVGNGSDEDDYMQESLIALLRAVRTFDEEMGVRFTSYASSCIRNALVSALKREKKRAEQNLVSLDLADENAPSGASPESVLIDRESTFYLYKKILSALSEYEKRVFSCYLAKMDCAQIGALLDRDEKSISNALFRIRRKLQTLLEDEKIPGI